MSEPSPPELATSRYQAGDLILASGLVPVRITRGHPRFRLKYQLRARIPELAPGRETFAIQNEDDFEAAYRSELEAVGAEPLAEKFASLSNEHECRGLVLLCFEDFDKLGEGSCHRRVFARWWWEKTGQVVPELQIPRS